MQTAVIIAQYAREDLEQGTEYVKGLAQGSYLLSWGWILFRLGSTQHGLTLLERALEIVQGEDQSLELQALNNMAGVYQSTGKPQEALKLYEQALSIAQVVSDRAVEATTLNNMAMVYQNTGKPQEALKLLEQALSIAQEVGNRAMEASLLANIALLLYQSPNRSGDALPYMEQAITVLITTGLPQDSAGRTAQVLRLFLQSMRAGTSPDTQAGGLATW